MLALGLVAIGVRRYVFGGRGTGYVRLTAVPWAQVVSIRTAKGKPLGITGETPVRVSLPRGQYIIELKNGEATEEEKVEVEAGKTYSVNHTFRKVKVDELVEELLSQ